MKDNQMGTETTQTDCIVHCFNVQVFVKDNQMGTETTQTDCIVHCFNVQVFVKDYQTCRLTALFIVSMCRYLSKTTRQAQRRHRSTTLGSWDPLSARPTWANSNGSVSLGSRLDFKHALQEAVLKLQSPSVLSI